MEFPESFIRLIDYDAKERINIIAIEIVYPINKSLAIAISPLFSQAIIHKSKQYSFQ